MTSGGSSAADGVLADALHDLRAALRTGTGESVSDVLFQLAHAVRAFSGQAACDGVEARVRLVQRLQLLPMLQTCLARFGVSGTYKAKLILCILANLAEAGAAAAIREGGGLALLAIACESTDPETRYLAVAALRNQLAFDFASHALVKDRKLEALLTMMLGGDVDARTLDCACSAMNNLYGLSGARARALGVPPPLPRSCADSLARHTGRGLRSRFEELAFGSSALGGGGQLPLLAASLVPGPAPRASTRGGSARPQMTAESAKMQLLLRANIRRHRILNWWAAACVQALVRGWLARREHARVLAERCEVARRLCAALVLQAGAYSLFARRAASAARAAEAAEAARASRAAGYAQRWLLRARAAQLARSERWLLQARADEPSARAAHEAQLSQLRLLRDARKLSADELHRLSEGVVAAHAAFLNDIPAAELRVAKLSRWVEGAQAWIEPCVASAPIRLGRARVGP
ncbi:hypothetical protein T492DRAFT_1070413 [Pavlovales sp. CCMP2436]|nr:hypothetical protein T492DRAFT_1070413 [Pavlovales sp. CCMP2436]